MVNDKKVDPGVRYAASEMNEALTEYCKAGHEFINKRGMSPYENTNPAISKKGWEYIKTHVEKDTHFQSVIGTRINSLIANPWKIVPAQSIENGRIVIKPEDIMIADFVRAALQNVDKGFESDIVAMMNHIPRGYSLNEINWRYMDKGKLAGKLGIRDIRYKQPELFSFKFDEYGRYSLNQTNPEMKAIPLKNKFVHFINGLDDENPYGESIAANCAFWVYLKENDAKFWAVFAERFGMPFTKLEVPPNMSESDKLVADNIIKKIHTTTGMQIPKEMVLTFLEATRSGDANYRGLWEMSDSEMSKAVLGSTLAVETQKNTTSTHAASSSHENTMGIQLNFDVISSMSGINQQLIKPLVDFNYPNVENYPKFVWGTFDVGGFITLAQGIEALLRSGLKIPNSWVHEITTIPLPIENEETLIYMPGLPVVQPGGVDNKVLNHKGVPEVHFKGTETRRHGEIIKFDKHEKDAKAEDAKNTTIINQGKAEVIKRWGAFAKQIAETKKYDREILAQFEANELGGVIYQLLMIGALNGIKSGKVEIGKHVDGKTMDDMDIYGRNGHNGLRTLIDRFFRGTEARRHGGFKRAGIPAFAGMTDAAKFDDGYKPFEDILKQFEEQNLISKEAFDLLSKEMQMHAFTVTNHDTEYILSLIHDELMQVLLGEADLPGFYERVVGIFESAGVIGTGNHIETVLRTNMQNQYINGRERVFAMTDSSEFPFKQVIAVMDSATRTEHARLNKYTRNRLDPVWSWLKPPFDYNCRCTLRMVHKSEQAVESDWVPDRGSYGLL